MLQSGWGEFSLLCPSFSRFSSLKPLVESCRTFSKSASLRKSLSPVLKTKSTNSSKLMKPSFSMILNDENNYIVNSKLGSKWFWSSNSSRHCRYIRIHQDSIQVERQCQGQLNPGLVGVQHLKERVQVLFLRVLRVWDWLKQTCWAVENGTAMFEKCW